MWPDTESDSDYLNFGEVSQLAVDILKSPDMLPCSIGVFGNWGALLCSREYLLAECWLVVWVRCQVYFKGASDRHQIDYLDKLIQVPIRVPKAGIREIRSYLFMLYAVSLGVSSDKLEALRAGLEESLRQSWRDEPISRQDALALTGDDDGSDLATAYDRADRIAPVLANSPIIHGNPRIVQRLLNVVKMRSQIARRRSMPLDEAVITKLVIFERCVGTEATADFYRFVDAERGKPTILKELQEGDGSDLPTGVPKSWSTNPTTKSFILEWSQLEPFLRDVDLRAAIYLSRDTMPLGAYVVGLSPQGREALNVLVGVNRVIGNHMILRKS